MAHPYCVRLIFDCSELVPQDEIFDKLLVHFQNPKNTTKLKLMRFLQSQPVPQTLDLTYFGKSFLQKPTPEKSTSNRLIEVKRVISNLQ